MQKEQELHLRWLPSVSQKKRVVQQNDILLHMLRPNPPFIGISGDPWVGCLAGQNICILRARDDYVANYLLEKLNDPAYAKDIISIAFDEERVVPRIPISQLRRLPFQWGKQSELIEESAKSAVTAEEELEANIGFELIRITETYLQSFESNSLAIEINFFLFISETRYHL